MVIFRIMGQNREVFITVRVEETDYFRREGFDVHTTVSISNVRSAVLIVILACTQLCSVDRSVYCFENAGSSGLGSELNKQTIQFFQTLKLKMK
jgi:hypothetical protein